MNGLAYNEKDSRIVVSGRNQGLSKISWDDELKWILSENKNWEKSGRIGDGFDTEPYLLKAVTKNGDAYPIDVQNGNVSVEDFDFAWGPHAPEFLPNGNIIVFDNGVNRNFNDENNYSRAVEYEINETDKTVKQVWQFGKERGEAFYSSIISDVDYLYGTDNILVTSGFVTPKKNHNAKIVEVDHITGEVVFEATLYFKTLTGKKVGGWGQTDLMYRSERLELKY
jgi:arylsulfate sulfotransferase